MTEKQRFPYSRPEFLFFNEDEITVSADQTTRPVIVPKDPSRMPVYAGYAEAINAGTNAIYPEGKIFWAHQDLKQECLNRR
jgi:hypothetical protein